MTRKVLFLALSGVRVREPELLALGMTLPGFIERGKTIAALPSLGLLTLAGQTPPDWHPEYRELDAFSDDDIAAVVGARYSLVAISALTARIKEAYAIADHLREHGVQVVLGGLHVSALPDEAADHADAVVIGEGEAVWPELLRDAAAGQLQPRYDGRNGFSLDHSPLPRYDLLNPADYNRLTIQTARGCPHDCTFCGASRLISRYKTKPLPLIRRDLEAILALWRRPFIELADDNTFVNKAWSRQLVALLQEYNMRWFTETDISVADDPELLDLLVESGCAQVLIGLESAAPQSLAGIDSRDWKLRQRDSYLEKIARIQGHGVSVNGCFTLGLDGDTLEVFEQTRQFVRESALAEVQITVLTPFPGTELYATLARQNRLLSPDPWDRCTLFDVCYQPAQMTIRELEQGFAWLMKELYNDEATAERKRNFRRIIQRRGTHPTPAGETP